MKTPDIKHFKKAAPPEAVPDPADDPEIKRAFDAVMGFAYKAESARTAEDDKSADAIRSAALTGMKMAVADFLTAIKGGKPSVKSVADRKGALLRLLEKERDSFVTEGRQQAAVVLNAAIRPIKDDVIRPAR